MATCVALDEPHHCFHVRIQNIPSGWGPDMLFLSPQSSTYFTEGRTDLPREAIGPVGSNCFSMGACTTVPDFLQL